MLDGEFSEGVLDVVVGAKVLLVVPKVELAVVLPLPLVPAKPWAIFTFLPEMLPVLPMSGSSLQAKEDQYLGEESCSGLHPLLLMTRNIFTTFHLSQTRWCPSSNHFGELLDPGCFPKSTRPVCGGKISIYERSTKSFSLEGRVPAHFHNVL